MVFAASWRPWPIDIAAAEITWAPRKPRLSLPGWPFRKVHIIATITRKPSTKPINGEAIVGTIHLSVIVCQLTWPSVAKRVAPTRPPSRAWVEDDGRPKYQVIR